ncbi:protein TAPETUM DETERMINANT 1-like [Henckelia pumila]|uniref:protein TAPETUM DETERMINANT 1-like n=1 Tax=Henckelia pumila TaxID=405737 RepID=UPI003C6E806A
MNTFYLLFYFFMVLIVVLFRDIDLPFSLGNFTHFGSEDANRTTSMELEPETHVYYSHRKLMLHVEAGTCRNRDISISQSRYSTSGIPQFIVQIVNTCVSGCAPSDIHIHIHCGWFASARIVNPRIFKRLSFDDCVVNGGKPMKSSQIIRFTYANSFIYPLEFKYATFC